jgi:hypothetical protein
MSFCQTSIFIVGVSQPGPSISGPRTCSMREPPAPSASTFTASAGRMPQRWPSSRASAVETLWMATSRLAISFMRMPLPKAPRLNCDLEKPSNTGCSRRMAAAGPLA